MMLAGAFAALAPPAANAQQVHGSDLVTLLGYIETGGVNNQGIDNNPAHFHFVIKNQGDQTFQSQGWEFKWGFGDPTNPTCPYSSTPVVGPTSCERIFQSTVNATDTQIAPQTTIELVFDWTPTDAWVGQQALVTWIVPLPPNDQQPGQGPDDHPENNVATFPIFVKQLGVEAVPDRDIAPQGSDVNSPWAKSDITLSCLTDPTVNRKGCKGMPATLVDFNYNVKNLGNALDSYYGTVLDTNNKLQSRGWVFHFVPQNFTLDVNQTQAVTLQIAIPQWEWSDNGTNVGDNTLKVRWASRLDPNVNTLSTNLCNNNDPLCGVDPSFPSILVDHHRALNATTNDTVRIANVTQVVTFNVTMNNTGNDEDTYTLSIDNDTAQINSSWNIGIDWQKTVARNTTVVETITMVPPTNATAGLHLFNVTFQSQNDTDGSTLQTLRFAANVQQNFSVTGAMDTGLIRVLPDQKASYLMHVTNLGNGLDNVTLTLQNVPYLWTASLSQTVVPVPPFSSVPVYLNVTPPPGTAQDTQASFFINATSQGPPTLPPTLRSQFSLRGDLDVSRGPNIRVTTASKSAFVDAGGTTTFPLLVTNTGNLGDTFGVAVNRSADQLAWVATASPTSVTLAPLQQGTVLVNVSAPSSAAVGETTQVFATVTSTFDPAIQNATTLLGRVSGPDLFVSQVLVNSTNPYSGDPVEVDVVLGNDGNKAPDQNVTLNLYFMQNGAPVGGRPIATKTYAPSDLPGGRRLSESFIWDTTDVEGAGDLVAKVNEDHAIAEIDTTNDEADHPLTLRTLAITVTPAQGLSGLPGEKVSYSAQPNEFLVTYAGNQPSEPADILISSDHGWGSAHQTIQLPQGTAVAIPVDVHIPLMPGVPNDTLRITVVPTLRPQALITSSTITTVVDHDPPDILDVTATPASVNLGQTTTLATDVTDATGLSSVRAYVVRPDNVTDTYLMDPPSTPGGTTWTHAQPFLIAGTYRVYVEAIDNAQPANDNTSRDTVVFFNVTPGSAPVIVLADGQSTTIRSGSFVRFNITDPLGIKDASYVIQGISYDLGRFPFEIDTSSFPQGPITVTVIAHNIYGVESNATFQLTVDNTPPGIHSVTLDPAKPKANQDVTLTIETDPSVESVEVAIKRSGQLVDTREATRERSGEFQLLLNPAQGDYTIDVTAKDVAGNTKLQEGAVVFSAKPASPLPGFELVLGLGAAAVVALAMRRRR
jgi:uncharacterized membrane protein